MQDVDDSQVGQRDRPGRLARLWGRRLGARAESLEWRLAHDRAWPGSSIAPPLRNAGAQAGWRVVPPPAVRSLRWPRRLACCARPSVLAGCCAPKFEFAAIARSGRCKCGRSIVASAREAYLEIKLSFESTVARVTLSLSLSISPSLYQLGQIVFGCESANKVYCGERARSSSQIARPYNTSNAGQHPSRSARTSSSPVHRQTSTFSHKYKRQAFSSSIITSTIFIKQHAIPTYTQTDNTQTKATQHDSID